MKVRLNLNWCVLSLIMVFTSFAYAFDAWNLNLPLGPVVLAIVLYLGIAVMKRQRIPGYWSNNLILRGYGFLLIVAVVSAIIHKAPPLAIETLQFFYLPVFVMFFQYVIRSPEVLRKAQRLIGRIFWISFVMFLIQQFILGTDRDELTGLFGITTGNQGYTNILLVYYSLYVLAMYLGGKMKLGYVLAVMVASLYQAAVGEIKVYFIMLILIAGCLFFMSRLTMRKCGIAVITLVLGMLAVSALEVLYPEFTDFMSVDSIINVITNDRGYTSSGDINRLNGVLIMRKYMKSPAAFLLGIGVGQAGKGTDFYRSFGWLHYSWFAYSYIFVELGILGLAVLVGTHTLEAGKILYQYYHEKNAELKILYLISFIYNVILVAYMFYNEKHFTVIGAMYNALFISLPAIYRKVYSSESGAQT